MEMAASLQREEMDKMPIDVRDGIDIQCNKKSLSSYKYVLYCNSCQ
jgi:hypothetical protein